MPEMNAHFWTTIDRTRPEGRDPTGHAEALTRHLTRLGLDTTRDFSRAFDEAMDSLFRWDLWGAAYLALGGCGDDAFEYLRAWLISDGEATWALSRDDPEQLFLRLLAGSDDPDSRWADLGLHEGEPILYAAGKAHEELTGEWLPIREKPAPGEPAGEDWEEEDLPRLFPALAAALPDGWSGSDAFVPSRDEVILLLDRGVAAFADGDHATAGAVLEPLVEQPENWAVVATLGIERRTDAAYVVGIGRLLRGDVDGAATALRLVQEDLDDFPHIRRALAQIELARGEFQPAGELIDDRPDAARLDRVLAAKLAWRRGDRADALRRADQEMLAPIFEDEHPWDVAGSIQQLGQVFVEAGESARAEVAAQAMVPLLRDAPDDLPLNGHLRLLLAGIIRLQGRPQDAIDHLTSLTTEMDGTDLAEALRERARSNRSLGRDEESSTDYERAIALFERAGEVWEADFTRREASGSG